MILSRQAVLRKSRIYVLKLQRNIEKQLTVNPQPKLELSEIILKKCDSFTSMERDIQQSELSQPISQQYKLSVQRVIVYSSVFLTDRTQYRHPRQLFTVDSDETVRHHSIVEFSTQVPQKFMNNSKITFVHHNQTQELFKQLHKQSTELAHLAIKSIQVVGKDNLLLLYEGKLFYDVFDKDGNLLLRSYIEAFVSEVQMAVSQIEFIVPINPEDMVNSKVIVLAKANEKEPAQVLEDDLSTPENDPAVPSISTPKFKRHHDLFGNEGTIDSHSLPSQLLLIYDPFLNKPTHIKVLHDNQTITALSRVNSRGLFFAGKLSGRLMLMNALNLDTLSKFDIIDQPIKEIKIAEEVLPCFTEIVVVSEYGDISGMRLNFPQNNNE